MFTVQTQPLEGERVVKFMVRRVDGPLRYGEAVTLWRTDATFCDFFNQLLAAAPFTAYFWETPSVTRETVDRPFEFVLVDSPRLVAVRPDVGAFAEHFTPAGEPSVVTFANISGDAVLVAPCPRGPLDVYPHLAAFARGGPLAQQQALWRRVGEAVAERLSDRPLWLSTSGMGVYWLHVRLDSRPKYYNWRPYTVLE
jgi:hypothetical protein